VGYAPLVDGAAPETPEGPPDGLDRGLLWRTLAVIAVGAVLVGLLHLFGWTPGRFVYQVF